MLKKMAGPFRKYFNARFGVIHASIVQLANDERSDAARVSGQIDRAAYRLEEVAQSLGAADDRTRSLLETASLHRDESMQNAALLGRSVDELTSRLDAILAAQTESAVIPTALGELSRKVAAIAQNLGAQSFDLSTQGALQDLEAYGAAVANYTNSHNGWASQAGLWFNPPLSIEHAAGGVSLADVNERIAEVPFVYRALAGITPGARVLDVGATESSVSVSLATLGYNVTAVDPRPYPLSHSRLTIFQGAIGEFSTDDPFDAVILLSSIEHFGLGAYELPTDENADIRALAHIHSMVKPGGRLILTTPYGIAPTTELERTYSAEQLSALLVGWEIEEIGYLSRVSATEWTWVETVENLEGNNVALVSAVRSGSPL